GIQTPPPSNPTGKRRRGRPPKNPQANPGASIAFVKERKVKAGAESYDTTPTKVTQPVTQSSPVLQQLDNLMGYSNHNLQTGDPLVHNSIDFHSNKYWDASFTGSVMSESNP